MTKNMRRALKWWALVLVAMFLLPLVSSHRVFAQEETPVSLIVSPQVWFSNIPESRSTSGTTNRKLQSVINPQWGGSLAFQYGTWIASLSGLAVDYQIKETLPANVNIDDASRADLEFTLTRTFLDVIKDRLDLSLGVGMRLIHVEGTETIVEPPGSTFAATSRTREKYHRNLYGATFPIGLNFHISPRLFLPVGITPMVGTNRLKSSFGDTRETDFGGNLDLGLRYAVTNDISLYGGYRLQVLTETLGKVSEFLAHGPVIGMSVRFGLK